MSETVDRPNILLIVLDSVRASNTTLHDHINNTTPYLKEFATRSTVYEQARAPSIWSLPSHVSIFTGTPAHVHGVTTGDQKLQKGHTIWEHLSDEYGYSTGLFTSNVYLSEPPFGLRDTFETIKGRDEIVRYPEALTPVKADESSTPTAYIKSCLSHDSPVKSIFNGIEAKGRGTVGTTPILRRLFKQDHCTPHAENFKNWIDTQTGPWAACINFMDAHSPYLPEDQFDHWGGSDLKSIQNSIDRSWDFPTDKQPWWKCEALESLYDGAIRQMDAEIKGIVNQLKEWNQFKNTHIVITADHGEGFGELCNTRPGVRYVAHGYGIDESLVHVPLLSKRPRQQCGERRDSLASLTSFYDVIKDQVENNDNNVSFEKNSVTVSSHERNKQIDKYVGNNTRYHGDAFAVYREDGDEIRKFTRWGDHQSIVKYKRNKLSSVLSVNSTNHGEVTKNLIEHQSNSLSQSGTNPDELEENTKDRLENLGYM